MPTKNETAKTVQRKRLKGVVVSTGMQKTIVVEVTSLVKVPKYGKYVKRSKRYKAHDEKGLAKLGETVVIESCRPISKEKHFALITE